MEMYEKKINKSIIVIVALLLVAGILYGASLGLPGFPNEVQRVGAAAVYVRSGGVSGSSFSFDIGSISTDRLIVIIAGDESDTVNLTGATVDGKACNLVTRANNTSNTGNHQEMWYCDEDNLGASNGVVTVAITGGDAGWAVHAYLYTDVSQAGPTDFGIDETSLNTTITVSGIDVPANGLVVMGAGEGTAGLTVTSWTSPLVEYQNGPDPNSADLMTASGIETSAQTNKTYVATFSADFSRGTGIVAVWPEISGGGGGVSVSRVQSATAADGTTSSATFGVTPTEGNLLIAISAHRQEGLTPSITGSGWNLVINRCYAVKDGACGTESTGNRRALAVWHKVAGSSEPTNVQTSWSPGSNNGLIIQEFEIVGGGTFAFDSQVSNDSATTDVISLTTGMTTQSAQADSLLITAMMSRALTGAATWTNGVVSNVYFDASGSGSNIGMNTGFGVDATQSTKESTGSWGTARRSTTGMLVFSVTVASVGSIPTVTTNSESGISTITATLNGSVNPNEDSTTGWFRYDTTNPSGGCDDVFGTRVPSSGGTNVGSGTSTVSYSQSLSSLSANTDYHYCAIASNSYGTTTGTIVTFKTANPEVLKASVISSTFDTGIPGGVKINTISWQGVVGAPVSAVKFQIASSNCSNGATDSPSCTTDIGWLVSKTSGDGALIGPDGTSITFYTTTAPNIPSVITTDQHNNARYFRYLVEISRSSLSDDSPIVRDVIINWSP